MEEMSRNGAANKKTNKWEGINERKMATGAKKDVKMPRLDVQYILVKLKRYKRYKEIKDRTIYYYNTVRMRKSKVPTEVLLDSLRVMFWLASVVKLIDFG